MTDPDEAIFYIMYPGDKQERGPHTLNELRTMWAAGTIDDNTLFATKDMQQWMEIRTMREKMQATRNVQCGQCNFHFNAPTDVPLIDQRCPACSKVPVKVEAAPKVKKKETSESMATFGTILFLVGALGMVGFAFIYPTSVANAAGFGDGGPTRIFNLGLGHDRLVGMVGSTGLALIGAIFLAADAIASRMERVAKSAV